MRSVQSSIYSIVYAPNTDYVFLRFSVLSFVFFFSLGLIFLSRLFFKAPQATRSVGCRCNVFNMSRCPDVCPVVPCQHGLVRRAGKSITTTILATALVSSRLDYANSILFGCPLKYRLRLQRVQSAVARITVPQNSSFPIRSTTALLRHLHWLPIDSRISFKLSTVTFKALGSGRPPYLASLLHNYSPPRTMRSSSAKPLTCTVPCHSLSLNTRASCISAPTTWNSLSAHVLFTFLLPPPGTRSQLTCFSHFCSHNLELAPTECP